MSTKKKTAKASTAKPPAAKPAPKDSPDDRVKLRVVMAKPKPTKKRGKMSGLDAAAKVMADAGKPLTAQEIVEAMTTQGLWKTSGKTPHSTIYAAIIREIAKKGTAGRFRKTDRGHFTVAKGVK